MQLPEILLIDKESGMTSFDVIRVLRKKTGIQKFGHAGTLDPLATGLMILGVEKGTKLLENYIKLDKEYVAEIRIGEKRTTGDLEGEIIESANIPVLERSAIENVLKQQIGTIRLPVSAYSAIKKEGKPMYKRAREAALKGEQVVDVPWRDMIVHDVELLDVAMDYAGELDRCVVTVRYYVGSGTYIRSLAEDLGSKLGYPATLQSLRRTRIGDLSVVDAKKLSEF